MKKQILPVFALLAALSGLCSCQSTMPNAADMDRYYKAAEAQEQRQIARYAELRDQGKLTPEEYELKVQKAHADVGAHAMDLAWTRHYMEESKKQTLGIPTGDHAVALAAPGIGSSDSFYRPAGQTNSGYQGMGSGMWHGYQPGSMVDALSGTGIR